MDQVHVGCAKADETLKGVGAGARLQPVAEPFAAY